METRTKIVATVGPASDRAPMLDALIAAGVDVFRLNLSHGRLDDHLALLQRIRERAEAADRAIAVLADLPGPKVRAGDFGRDGCSLVPGETLVLCAADGEGSSAHRVTVEYPSLLDDVRVGDRVIIGDGAIELRVDALSAADARCTVRAGGVVRGRPGVHLPSERIRLATPTEVDIELARRVVAAGVDFVAVSFVRLASDVRALRDAIRPATTRLVAKIETSTAVGDLDAIIAESDALMVARGDLGIDCPIEDVPLLQKRIIARCVQAGRPVITATQMMESMITSPLPTRAEVSDVANAVADGTDALMLSGETAVGRDPELVVRTMARVAARADDAARGSRAHPGLDAAPGVDLDGARSAHSVTRAIARAAAVAAQEVQVAAILCCTRGGRTVEALTRFRPDVPLLALSPDPATVRAMALCWGAMPMQIDEYSTTDEMVRVAIRRARAAGFIRSGDTVMVLGSAPDAHSAASTDVLRLASVGPDD